MNKTTVPIKGMHCRSCELLIEDELISLPGVKKVEVSHSKGEAVLYHATPNVNHDRISSAVKKAGYVVGKDAPKPFFSNDPREYRETFQAVAIIVLIFFIGSQMGLTKVLSGDSLAPSSLPLIFLIGITAGFSTCMALIGGLVLGVSALFAKKNPDATATEKFRPHLAFNVGRIISYFVLGGLIGALGGLFQFSSSILGVITLGVGLLMIVFGIQLTGLFPRLASMSLTLPAGIGKILGIHNTAKKEYSDISAAMAGATTFFLPCGFTQTMQLFAMSTGSFTRGAMVMGIFALGTMPGLLGIGGISSMLKGNNARMFYKVAGVIVIFFAFINISRGLNLTGWKSALAFNTDSVSETAQVESAPKAVKIKPQAKDAAGTVPAPEGNEQVITAVFNGGYDLAPSEFNIKVGQPIRFVVDAKRSGSGCMSAMMIPGLVNRPKYLQGGTKIEFVFTAQKPGEYQITCAMGVPWGSFKAS